MNLLNVEKMSKSFTDKILFDKVTLGISEGDKIGIIGINGTGKSTLLKIIAGIIEPDEGTVVKGKTVQVDYLPQKPVFDPNLTIIENILLGKKAKEEYRNLEGEAKTMLTKLGITDFDGKTDILSGGQKKRVALVRTLLIPGDILILDEPTNHLDMESIQAFNNNLKLYKGNVLFASHDHEFINTVANRIIELTPNGVLDKLMNYEDYIADAHIKEQREQLYQA